MKRPVEQRGGVELLEDVIALIKEHGEAADDIDEYHEIREELERRLRS